MPIFAPMYMIRRYRIDPTDHERKRAGMNVSVVYAAVVLIGVVPVSGTLVIETEPFGF